MAGQPAIRWIGAHPNNFTSGRSGRPIGNITFHHIVGSLASADATFQNAARQASATFGVGASEIHQYVALGDTSYANGNWESNLRSITIEHEGDWRFGYTNEAVLNRSAELVAWLRTIYPGIGWNRHRDVSQLGTACPGDLPCEEIWARSEKLLNPPASQTPEWLKNRVNVESTVYAQIDGLRLINLNDVNQYADGRSFARNTDFQIGSETTVGGVKYLITKSSTDLNKANGIRAVEVATSPWQPAPPPTPEPAPVPPSPTTPEWELNLKDIDNKKMYITTNTFLVDLTNGLPVYVNNTEIKFTTGQAIDDISAFTIVGGKTYMMTEYSFNKHMARGIEASALSDSNPTDPVPPVTPPTDDTEAKVNWLVATMNAIINFFKGLSPWK